VTAGQVDTGSSIAQLEARRMLEAGRQQNSLRDAHLALVGDQLIVGTAAVIGVLMNIQDAKIVLGVRGSVRQAACGYRQERAAREGIGQVGHGCPMISRDGRWLAYMSNESGTYRIYVERFPGGGAKAQISDDGGTYPAWSRNGREIFFWQFDERHPKNELMVAPYQARGDLLMADKPRPWSGRPLAVFSTTRSYDPAPDGKHIVALVPADAPAEGEGRVVFLLNFFDELRRRAPVSGFGWDRSPHRLAENRRALRYSLWWASFADDTLSVACFTNMRRIRYPNWLRTKLGANAYRPFKSINRLPVAAWQ
jgi:hypothetical protein